MFCSDIRYRVSYVLETPLGRREYRPGEELVGRGQTRFGTAKVTVFRYGYGALTDLLREYGRWTLYHRASTDVTAFEANLQFQVNEGPWTDETIRVDR